MSAPTEESPAKPHREPRARGLELFLLAALAAALICCVIGLRRCTGETAPWLRYGLRISVVLLSLRIWFRTQALIARRGLSSEGIADGVHIATASLHGWLASHPKTADRVLIGSSFFIDLFGLFVIAVGILGPSLQPFVALLILFGMRQVCQAVCALPVPPGMIWRNPGFPSLLVTYGTANDFFFSGHTAIAVLGALVMFDIAPLWLAAAAGVVAMLEAAVVLVLRAHYTMDVVAAVLAALFAHRAAAWMIPGM